MNNQICPNCGAPKILNPKTDTKIAELAVKEVEGSHDWSLVPNIKISALRQHLRKISGMDSLEDIEKLYQLVEDLTNKKTT